MAIVAEFDGFKLREVGEADYPVLDEWIAADPQHRDLFEPDFFLGREVDGEGVLASDPRATCYALEYGEGTVFYIRLSRAARVHIQFPPADQVKANAKKTALGLIRGMAILEVGLSRAGAAEWIFETESPTLKKLVTQAMGFRESKSEMVRPIAQLEGREKLLQGVHEGSEGGS